MYSSVTWSIGMLSCTPCPGFLHLCKTNTVPIRQPPLAPTFHFLFLWIWVTRISEILQHLSFHNCLISLSVLSSEFMLQRVSDFPPFPGWIIFLVRIDYFVSPFFRLLRPRGLFLLATANNAAVNVGVQIFLWGPAFNCFVYIPKSCVDSIFNFPRNSRNCSP